ncbi:lantibiotic dehydratase [Tengunoibacter tsumagoiensis]|uniref:Lantibiotic dehydratase N-terminal domain-containing protein n=1 Tax=Tengunoibacter tsumagoiensis TaxID=2014871 RepID=A0A402A394_9CHLR|nr:lantibiotic dehydratase [Tengunoibacter tsumagoiensis]GCE13515.1 hypothetical protein KTT_33740 [Tengunoibacter tsumagoiensis]
MQDGNRQTDARDLAALPPHLMLLDGGEWAIWRWVALRSAGFSHAILRPLVASTCVEAAEEYLSLERQPQITADELAASRTTFEKVHQEARMQTLRALHDIGRAPAFREALIWQNRQVLHSGVDVLLAVPPEQMARSGKYRKKEALVTRYIQRYCTKNDTISFFGPAGWARCMDDGPALTVQPGPTLLAKRTTYFEGWCIDALAEHLARDQAFEPWLVPRLFPHLWLVGTKLHRALASAIELEPAQAVVLAACDGVSSAQQIAQNIVHRAVPGAMSEADVYAILRHLRSKHYIAWTLEISVEGLHPEQRLRSRLASIGESSLRTSALEALDELEKKRDELVEARGDVERLDRAMTNLEETFSRLTGRDATRLAGSMYAGRTLVYEDCQRDVDVKLGPELASTLGAPLSLLLTSARWFTYEASTLYQDAFQTIYEELTTQKQSTRIAFGDFWPYANALLFDRKHPLLKTLCHRFQQRWQELLKPSLEQRHMSYQVAELRQSVLETFAAPGPGWRAAQYHSPDIMIAAPSLERLRQGEYSYILGELHPAGNTQRIATLIEQHPAADELYRAIEVDCPQSLVLPIFSREARGISARMGNGFVRSKDWRLIFAGDSCEVPVEQALPIGLLEIERSDTGLVVYTRDRAHHWTLIELLGDLIMLQILQHFSLLPQAMHTPRISFDRLVVLRETWCFAAEEIAFAALSSESERFLAARRWLHTHQLPRHLFLKTPGETKPFYVDFESLVSVDIFAHAVRRAADSKETITVSEMLPDLHETWLIDQQQQPYTSELRFVAVDQHVC